MEKREAREYLESVAKHMNLQAYKMALDTAIEALKAPEDRTPLTVGELRSMTDKPILVVNIDAEGQRKNSRWHILRSIVPYGTGSAVVWNDGGRIQILSEYNKTWIAFGI